MPNVKCIKIDSKNETVTYVNVEIEVQGSRLNNPLGYEEGYMVYCAKHNRTESIVMYFDDGTIDDPKKIPRHGFLYWSSALEPQCEKMNFSDYQGSCRAVIGDALIVTYKEEKKNGKRIGLSIPIDTTLSLENAARLVGKYNEGIESRLPDFTCLINERFSHPGYEILLRLENEEELGSLYDDVLDQPIRNLSPQILTFSFAYHEITVITGRIENLDEKVQISIFESDRADLRCLASCTLAANKIPAWVNGRLRDYYFNTLVAAPLNKKVGFAKSMEEMHQRLGID